MAKRGADGAIILETEIDETGIKNGIGDMKSAATETEKAFKSLGDRISRALKQGDVKTAQLASNYKKATAEVARQSIKVKELKEQLAQLESGEIIINDKGVGKIQTELDKACASVEKAKSEIEQLYAQLDHLQANAFKAPDTGEIVFTAAEKAEFEALNAKLDELEPKLETNRKKADELGAALKNATGAATQAEIEKVQDKLSAAEGRLGELTTKAKISEQKLENGLNNTNKQASRVSGSFGKMGSKLYQLAKGALVFSAITKGFTALRQTIGSALMSNEQFRNSVYSLQAALWTVAEPIYQAILPALQTLMKWLTLAALYVATFFSAMGGKTLKQTIASAKALNRQAQAYENVSKSAKEAHKQLASFDDLDVLQSDKSAGTVNLSGIQNGFDDLESLLNDSDMENLHSFERWVLENQESIKTALEIAGLGALGLGIAGVISKIGNLLGWFKKKDNALDTQTQKTQTETEAVRGLSYAFSLVPAFAYGLVPALDGLTQSGLEFTPAFQTATDAVLDFYPELDFATSSASAFTPVVNKATEASYALSPALDLAKHSTEGLVPAIQSAADNMYSFDIVTATAMPSIRAHISSAMSSGALNIENFATQTKANFASWAKNVQTNAINTANVVAKNIYSAFESCRKNITSFINTTSVGFAAWGMNVAENISNTAKNIATNFGSALASAWENFKNFMKATGEKVATFWNENKATIITGGVLVGLTIAGIALSPYTGGASLALPALAKGGVVSYPTTALIGEAGKEAVLPLESNTGWMDMLADRIAARNGGGGTTVILEVDGREFGRAVVEQGKKETRRIGTRLVMV